MAPWACTETPVGWVLSISTEIKFLAEMQGSLRLSSGEVVRAEKRLRFSAQWRIAARSPWKMATFFNCKVNKAQSAIDNGLGIVKSCSLACTQVDAFQFLVTNNELCNLSICWVFLLWQVVGIELFQCETRSRLNEVHCPKVWCVTWFALNECLLQTVHTVATMYDLPGHLLVTHTRFLYLKKAQLVLLFH